MARSRIATGLEKLMSDLPRLMLQRNLSESAQMKKLSIQATEGYLKEAANFTTVAQFDSAAANIMDELGEYGNDPTIAMAGNNAFKALGRLKENFIQKQEGVVELNSGFAKAKELNELDTTSGLNDIYKAAATTLEAKKQYFNSTEYSAYQKNLENLAEMIKVKSLTNYLDDLAVGETDEQGNIIVKPGIQSANSKLAMVNQLHKVGMINNRDAMKQLMEISEDINAGTMGVVLNQGAKAMKLLDRELQAFNMEGLSSAYTDKLLINFKTPLFTEKELTPETIGFVRDNLKETLDSVISSTGAFKDEFLQGVVKGKGLDGLEAYVNQVKSMDPNQSTADIIDKVVDEYGVDIFGQDPKGDKQKAHFAKMLNLYMKSNDMLDEFMVIGNNKTVDSSIGGYTNALLNYGATQEPEEDEEERKRVKVSTAPSPFIPSTSNQSPIGVLAPPPPPAVVGGTPVDEQSPEFKDVVSGKQNVLDLVRTIAEQQRAKEFSDVPFVPYQEPQKANIPPSPILDAMPKGSDVSDIVRSIKGITIPPQEPDQDDISYIDSINPSDLKNISKHLDKKVMNIYKKEAIKSLTKNIKELEILERSQSDASAERVSRELPRLRKLLGQFKKAKFKGISSMNINKDMLEYMYLMSSTSYDGVDDFIASLSDKIGIE